MYEGPEMLTLHKSLITIVCLLLLYDYVYESSYEIITIQNPGFTLLGPYNTTIPPPADEYYKLIDINDFSFKINSDPCKGYDAGLLLMVIVSSKISNFENRMTIRSTWGRSVEAMKVIFLIGETDNRTLIEKISNESLLHKDLVQGNFIDAYRNMTYKHVMGLKWITRYCPMARYVLKTDDDVLVNVRALSHFLVKELSPWGARDLIACQVLEHALAQRGHNSKWKVSLEEYGDHYYPTYCAGWAILYSRDVVFRLLTEAQKTPYFWIDDVHITGIIAQQIGVPRTPLKDLVLSRHRANVLTNLGITYVGSFLFGPPDLTVSRIIQIWKAIPE